MTTKDPGLQPERTALAWRRTFLAMIVSDFFIWRAWATSLGNIQSSSLGLGIEAAVAASATAVLGVLPRDVGWVNVMTRWSC
ncbi:DUF202 domain-containing protein [Arthrobacter globiformis]|uniref:DUF202 domain-containing protein n=1 Tax=Arthrobacter globiformis TaxID=1665 RepID=UPI00278185F9|nr:DUF202 domain-containing protein [Arthrobacter globiformis]MDQ0867349.1 uncharacterized membrane protein YidH (DUF202 family) [Arthrobacter globiformis]